MYLLFLTCYSFIFFASFADINPQGTLTANALQVSKAFFAKSRSSNFWRPVWHQGRPARRHQEYREIAVHVSTLVSRTWTSKSDLLLKNTEMYHSVWKYPTKCIITFMRAKRDEFLILSFRNTFFIFENLCRPFLMCSGKLYNILLNFTPYIRAKKKSNTIFLHTSKKVCKDFQR